MYDAEQMQGGVHSLSFSEKGYYLASAAHGDSVVRVLDLRKLEEPCKSIKHNERWANLKMTLIACLA